MLAKDKITEIFCIVDEFCKHFAIETAKQPKLSNDAGKRHRNRLCDMSDLGDDLSKTQVA
jgi:hypothetical protein